MEFHFYLKDGGEPAEEEVIELPDIMSAKAEALRFTSALLNDAGESFWQADDWHVEVTDKRGLMLFCLTVHSTEAPAIRGPHRQP